MNVVFRVDASLLVGSGHVMRCLVLAEEFARKGYEIEFACSPLEGDMRSFIRERGFQVTTLAKPREVIEPLHDADYTAWLQKSVSEDVQDFLTEITYADLVVTDHYAIGIEWQEQVIDTLDCRILAIDDLGRCHKADLILDQTLGRDEADYFESQTRVLVGSEFALLRSDFASKRESALLREISNNPIKVLVSMGGVDGPNATFKVLESLYGKVDASFTVVLSPRAPHFNQIKEWCSSKAEVSHLEVVYDMASLMLEHDIAIGAPGTTSWERACLGLPNVIVPLASNQQLICEQLIKHSAALKVDIEDISSCLQSEFLIILKQWSQFRDANLSLCDGRGARRVSYEAEMLLNETTDGLFLKLASHEDIVLIYDWQCHPETRKYALTPEVPTWSHHQTWMRKKLKSTTDYFYMIVSRDDGNKVGAVRLDRIEAGHYLVSIFLDPKSYGKGFALKALNIVDAIHPDVTLHASVLRSNSASHRLFQKCFYQQVDEETYIRQPIN